MTRTVVLALALLASGCVVHEYVERAGPAYAYTAPAPCRYASPYPYAAAEGYPTGPTYVAAGMEPGYYGAPAPPASPGAIPPRGYRPAFNGGVPGHARGVPPPVSDNHSGRFARGGPPMQAPHAQPLPPPDLRAPPLAAAPPHRQPILRAPPRIIKPPEANAGHGRSRPGELRNDKRQ